MVAHEPGPWFEEALAGLAAQTYPTLAVLVVAPTGVEGDGEVPPPDDDLEARIAAVLPDAHLRRVPGNPGFGPAANEALRAVSGAAFLLFCHDDVALAPDAVRLLVEEAYRSNAGIVGPKIVAWDAPRQLLQVGMGVSRAGSPVPIAEPGELDQEQHDGVADVFYVPSAAVLVRTDLFEAVGGFDPAIDFVGEDLDLCWRAAVAGARILVVPDAVARHRADLAGRRPDLDLGRRQLRHQLRSVLIDYGSFQRLRVMPQLVVLALLELVYALIIGRFHRAVDVASAWVWNLRHREGRRERRRSLQAVRTVPDREIRRTQARGSVRMATWLEERLAADEQIPELGEELTGHDSTVVHRGSLRLVVGGWAAAVLWLALASRDLVFNGVPAVGSFVPFPSSPGAAYGLWSSGFRPTGLGQVAPASIGTLLMGVLAVPFAGSGSAARAAVVVALLPVGAVGAWRMARPVGSRRARLASLAVYLAVPVAANAFANGRFDALVVYAATPWIFGHLARASGLAPYGDRGGPHGPGVPDRPWLYRVVGLALLLALVAIAAPAALLLALAIALVWTVASLLVAQPAGSGSLLGTAVAATAVAVALHAPWSLGLLHWSSASMSGPLLPPSSPAGHLLGLAEVARFQTGPFGATPLGWALLPASALALLIGRGWRLGWAARGWCTALAGWGAVLAVSANAVAVHLPTPEVLLAPAGVGLALAAAMGTAAFEVDLPAYQIGWRQIASMACAAALVVGLLPALATAVGGRFGMPDGDFQRSLQNLTADTRAPYRVLWIGDASVLPVHGWSAELPGLASPGSGRALAFGLTDGGGPTPEGLWAGPENAGLRQVVNSLGSAASGGSRLGALLAPMGVRFVVVAERLAPGRFANEVAIPQPRVTQVLESQLDLARVELAGATVYRNVAWGPSRAGLPGDAVHPGADSPPAERVQPLLAGATPSLGNGADLVPATGPLASGVQLYLATPRDPDLALVVDGRTMPSREVMGWATVFDITDGGTGTLTVSSRSAFLGLQAAQVAVWMLAAIYLLRTRVERDERRRDRRPAEVGA